MVISCPAVGRPDGIDGGLCRGSASVRSWGASTQSAARFALAGNAMVVREYVREWALAGAGAGAARLSQARFAARRAADGLRNSKWGTDLAGRGRGERHDLRRGDHSDLETALTKSDN